MKRFVVALRGGATAVAMAIGFAASISVLPGASASATPAQTAALAGPAAPVPPYSSAFGIAPGAWSRMCPPKSGSPAAAQVPPSSWASFLGADLLAGDPDWQPLVANNIDTAVHTGWDQYVAANTGQVPPGGFTSANFAADAVKSRLQDTLLSQAFWNGFLQRSFNVATPQGVNPAAFLGWMPDEQSGVSAVCDDPHAVGSRLWHSDTAWFWQSGSQWAELRFPDGSAPSAARSTVLAIPNQLGAYLVLSPTTSSTPTVTVSGILRVQPAGAPGITPASCAPNFPSASLTTQQMVDAVDSAVSSVGQWIPGVPVPGYLPDCDFATATYTKITGPTVDANSVRISDDAGYLLGWSYLPQPDGTTPPMIARWTLDGARYDNPVVIARAFDIGTGFDGVPRLAFSDDGTTAALCNAGSPIPPDASGYAHYPVVVHLDSGTAGWTQANVTDPSQCANLTLNADGSQLWWSQGGASPGWWTSGTNVPSAASPPPQVSITGVVDAATYEYGTAPTPGCSVTDSLDPTAAATPQLSPLSGADAAHGVGSATASCTYTDQLHRSASASATYRIVDTTPPVFATAPDVTAEATAPTGATVSFVSPTATDSVDGSTPVRCLPEPGTAFPIAVTTVACTTTDGSGNAAATQFQVNVRDTTPPALTTPSNLATDATGGAGAAVTYIATAVDLVDGVVTPVCSLASGSTFPIGDTTVSCSATDSHGNAAALRTFTIHIRSAAEQLTRLSATISALLGNGTSYTQQLQAASLSVASGQPAIAANQLGAFSSHVSGQSGKQFTAPQAAAVRAAVQRVIDVIES